MLLFFFNLRSSLFLYKSWFSTILLNICQDIYFTYILIKYKILKTFAIVPLIK